MGIKTVSINCELQVFCPRKEGGVSFCPIHTKVESLTLRVVALPPRNFSTVDNRRPGKTNNGGCIGPSVETKITNSSKTSEEPSGEHTVNA